MTDLHASSGPAGSSLSATRRARDLEALSARNPVVDVLVVGAGVTGAGTALDAASRGLSVLLIDKHDLAFGTSRWSSKLVHGGLRYLAHGQVGIAHESAVERGILISRTAPHLVHAMPMLLPLLPQVSRSQAALARVGFLAGDVLRATAGTRAATLPRSRRISRAEVLSTVPAVRAAGLRGGLLSWDGQLTDDARLVVALARTAAAHGARVITRCAAETLTGDGALLRDTLTGTAYEVRARAVINATGVWAGQLVDDISLRPSRGSHIVLPDRLFGGLRAAVTVPVPGETNRFVFALPQGDGRVYVGLTDEPTEDIADVPEATEAEIGFLLDTIGGALQTPVRRTDVIGSYAGLRPLLDTGTGRTADLSRNHAVLTSREGVITVVGGKLTTYRKMAEDAVDAAVAQAGLGTAGRCGTRRLPLVGAASLEELAAVGAPRRLVARYGTEAPRVLAEAGGDPELLRPLADGMETTGAELLFALRHEGALDAADLLERRTRIGLVQADADRALPAVRALLERMRI